MNLTEVKSVLDRAAQTEQLLKAENERLKSEITEEASEHLRAVDELRAARRQLEEMREEMSVRTTLSEIAESMTFAAANNGAILDEYRSLCTDLVPGLRSPLVNAAHSLIVLMNGNARETYAYLVRRGWKRTSKTDMLCPRNGDPATDFTLVRQAMKAQCLEDCMPVRDSFRRFMKHGLAADEAMIAGVEIKAGQAVAEIEGLAVPIVNKPAEPATGIYGEDLDPGEPIDASFTVIDDDEDAANGGPNNFDPAAGKSETVAYAVTQPETIGTVREPAIAPDPTPTLPMSGAQQWLLDGYEKMSEHLRGGKVVTTLNRDNEIMFVANDGFAMTVSNFSEGQKLAKRLSDFNQEIADNAATPAAESQPSIELVVRPPGEAPAMHVDVPPGYESPSMRAAATKPTTVVLPARQHDKDVADTAKLPPGSFPNVAMMPRDGGLLAGAKSRAEKFRVPHGLPEGGLGGRHPDIEAGGTREATAEELAKIADAAPAAVPLKLQRGRKVSRLISDGAGNFLIPKDSVQKLADKDAEQMQ